MHLGQQQVDPGAQDRGFAMAALLVSLSVMGLMMAMALPVWSVAAKREREAELIFRGEQYARAIELYQRKVAGAFPSDLDMLVEQRYLRRKYEDPMSDDGEFQLILQGQMAQAGGAPATASTPGQQVGRMPQPGGARAGSQPRFGEIVSGTGAALGTVQGGIVGVVSKSTETSLRLYNGRERYNEWVFMPVQAAAQPGGVAQPGAQPFAQPGQGGAGLGQGFGSAGEPGTSRPRGDGSGVGSPRRLGPGADVSSGRGGGTSRRQGPGRN